MTSNCVCLGVGVGVHAHMCECVCVCMCRCVCKSEDNLFTSLHHVGSKSMTLIIRCGRKEHLTFAIFSQPLYLRFLKTGSLTNTRACLFS